MKVKNYNNLYTEVLGKDIYEKRSTLILKCSCIDIYLQREEYFDDDIRNDFKLCPTCAVIAKN